MNPRPPYDFKNPDYAAEFRWRLELLTHLRADPRLLAAFRLHYHDHPADLINDFGVTFDPRNLAAKRPALVPFVLFPKQRECIEYLHRKWQTGEPGLIEKARDVGASWLTIAFGVVMCVTHRDFVAGFGSRKVELVDKLGDPSALFTKARQFARYLPAEFRAGWTEAKHGFHLKLVFPETDSVMIGEGGDNMGRGGRTSIYFVDEKAHVPRAQLVDASLSATTDCQIDLSSVNGMDNVFAQTRFSGRVEVFTFGWRDDPRKDQVWYDKQVRTKDPKIVAQEIDLDYAASVDGVVIESAWIRSAVDAHIVLGIEPTGPKRAGLDVADEGKDKNAFAGTHGIVLRDLSQWAGKGSDIFVTTQRAFLLCDAGGYGSLLYDADGLGSGVRGDARVLNQNRDPAKRLGVEPFRGSGEVLNPKDPIPSVGGEAFTADEKRLLSITTNEDFFGNRKAQEWWELRMRFLRTHRLVERAKAGEALGVFDPDELISLSSQLTELQALIVELSRPTWSAPNGKVIVNKAPDGVPSPNLADAVMIAYSRRQTRRRGMLSR